MTTLPNHGGGSDAPGAPVQQCENWIELRYEYEDGTGVGGASYVIQEPNDGKAGSAIIDDGVLDANGEKYVCLPLDKTDVEVFFYNDPEGEPYEDPDAETPIEEPYPGFFTSIWNGVSGAANWVWGVIQGDFNEDATTSQIIVNTIITMIPVVDQVGDVRDVAAILYRMIWKEEYNDKLAWIALFITLIGLVPTLGSLAKGVLKTVLRNADIKVLLKVYNWFGTKGNGYRWIKGLRDKLTGEHLDTIISTMNKLLDRAVEHLKKARDNYWTPGSWRAPIDKMKAQIAKFREIMPAKLREAAETLKSKLDEAIAAGIARIERAGTRKKHTQRQGKQAPARRFARTQEEYEDLARDPAKGGKIDAGSEAERDVGLGLEERGEVPGPIKRDPTGGAEFIDADGVEWDVKAYNSNFPNGFQPERIERQLEMSRKLGEKIMLDTRNLSASDLSTLRDIVAKKGLGDNVRFWP